MAKAFISYSRKDIEFAKKLTNELQKNELDFWVDWEGIPPSVDWWKQIEKGIEEADVFLFLISPDSAASKICAQEIECAIKNGKRLIPLVVRDVKGEDAPRQLGHINWIFFREQDDFNAALQKLLSGIHTDYEWAQNHRRLQVKALEWERNNHESSFLLRGKDLQDAEFQLATNTSKEPHPTDLQRDFAFKSRQAADRSRRITTGISVVGIISLAALAVFGFMMAGRATVSAKEAQSQAAVALTAQAKAETEQLKAEKAQKTAETESRNANTGRLALESKSALNEFPQRALLLALEAIRISQDANEPIRPDAEEALRLAAKRVSGIGLPGFKHEVGLIEFTSDDQWLVAGTNAEEGEVNIWNFGKLLNDPTYQPFHISFPVKLNDSNGRWDPNIYLSPQTTWLVMDGAEQTQLWKINTQDENREPLKFDGKIEFANSQDDLDVLEKQAEQVVLWRIDPENLSRKEKAVFSGSFASISSDQKVLVTDDPQKGLLLWSLAAPSTPPVPLIATHTADYKSIFIDPNNRWLILLRDAPREEIQVPDYDNMTIQSGTKAWEGTNITLIPLKKTNVPQEYTIELDMNIDTVYRTPKFSPDGNTFMFVGYSSPDTYGTTSEDFGLLKFNESEYSYLLAGTKGRSINAFSFINKDWLYISAAENETGYPWNTLLDLRQNDLFPGVELSTPLLVDDNGTVRFSEDATSMLTENGERIDFQQLELSHTIVLNPDPGTSTTDVQNELLLNLKNNPQAVGLEDAVTVSTISADNQWLAAGTRDGSLRFWNNINPWNSSNIRMAKTTNYITLSNDNQWMAVSDTLWHLKDGIPDAYYPLEGEITPGIAVFSPDSRWLVYIQDSGILPESGIFSFSLNVKLIDLSKVSAEGSLKSAVISKNNSMYSMIQFSADSRWVMLKEEQFDSEIKVVNSFIYDLENKKIYNLPYSPVNFSFTQDQKHVILVSGEYSPSDGTLKLENPEIWNLPAKNGERFEKIGEIETADPSVISQNGRWLLSMPKNDYAVLTPIPGSLWDANCVIENRECKPFTIPANSVGFSPDSNHLIVGYKKENDNDLPLKFDVWNLSNADQTHSPEKIYSGETKLEMPTISSQGNLLIFGIFTMNGVNPAGLFSTWNGYYGIGPNVTTFDGFGKLVLGMGGGGENIAGSFQKDYKVEAIPLDGISQSPLVIPIALRGHESNISTSQISPDEKFVLTFSGANRDTGGAAENLLRLWDLEKLRLDPTTKPVILPFDLGTERYISSLAFSPDSRWVYIIDSTNTLYYFPTSIEDLKKQACTTAGRNFIINEWERFFPDKEYRKTCENLPAHPSAISQ